MAPRFSTLIAISLTVASVLALPANPARADGIDAVTPALPGLNVFTSQVINGQGGQLRGVYATDLFSARVVQQPDGQPGFVSPSQGVLTQFGGASQFGSTGLLAHNYLAGAEFSQLRVGQVLYLVFGDGRTSAYAVTHLFKYQALQPNSDYSSFVDLTTGERLSAFSLFAGIYDRPGAVVLQTCIAANGLSTWGRLFVIAEPYTSPRLWRKLCSRCI